MKKTIVFILLCSLAVMGIFAAGCTRHTRTVESFVAHLEAQQAILEDTTLRGWTAQCRVGDYEGYIVRWYDINYKERYINYHIMKNGHTGYDYAIDTTMVCSLFNIQKDDIGSYTTDICRKLSILSNGYNIETITFSPNGYCFFMSEYNGWSIAYETKYLDTTYPMIHEYWDLKHHGYSRLPGHPFWYKKSSN